MFRVPPICVTAAADRPPINPSDRHRRLWRWPKQMQIVASPPSPTMAATALGAAARSDGKAKRKQRLPMQAARSDDKLRAPHEQDRKPAKHASEHPNANVK